MAKEQTVISGRDDMTKQPTSSVKQLTNVKLGKRSEVFTEKPRKVDAINVNTNKRNEENSMSLTRMALIDGKLPRSKEMAIGYKKVKE